MTCLSWQWIWAIDVVTWFLILVSELTRAIDRSSEKREWYYQEIGDEFWDCCYYDFLTYGMRSD